MKSPKRTHIGRRLALVPAKFVRGDLPAFIIARMGAAEAGANDAFARRKRRTSLRPWMKRADYLVAFDQEIRRGKWRARRQRREDRQWDRWYASQGSGTLRDALRDGES